MQSAIQRHWTNPYDYPRLTILDRLLGHDAWTTRQLLLRCRELSDEQLNCKFEIGNRSLLGTFEHLISCLESHVDLLTGRQTQEHYLETKALRDDETIDGMLARLTAVSKDFAEFSLKVEREGRADEMCTDPEHSNRWPLAAGQCDRASPHAQYAPSRSNTLLLEQLGVQDIIEGDALGWEGEARGWGYHWSNSSAKVAVDS